MHMTTIPNDRTADVPWPTSNQRMPAPDHSALPGNESNPPGATGIPSSTPKAEFERFSRPGANVINKLALQRRFFCSGTT
jgi:hypothetical protein